MEGRANRGSWGKAKKKKMGNEKYGGRPIWEFGGEETINIEERKMGDGQ